MISNRIPMIKPFDLKGIGYDMPKAPDDISLINETE
jgi:hypothetical protein